MSENEPVETIEQPLTEQDEADLKALQDEADGEPLPQLPEPTFHTVLEVWREVLKPAAEESGKKCTPQWCMKMLNMYPHLDFSDMEHLRNLYFGRLAILQKLLLEEIATDPDCLTWTSAEEDAEENAKHYKALLIEWQINVLGWELDWNSNSDHAAVDIASISEVHKLFFGDQGLTAFLEQIQFQYTEDDQRELGMALMALRERREAEASGE